MVGQPRAALGQTNRHVDGYDPEVARQVGELRHAERPDIAPRVLARNHDPACRRAVNAGNCRSRVTPLAHAPFPHPPDHRRCICLPHFVCEAPDGPRGSPVAPPAPMPPRYNMADSPVEDGDDQRGH
jgi:hypothetical protein